MHFKTSIDYSGTCSFRILDYGFVIFPSLKMLSLYRVREIILRIPVRHLFEFITLVFEHFYVIFWTCTQTQSHRSGSTLPMRQVEAGGLMTYLYGEMKAERHFLQPKPSNSKHWQLWCGQSRLSIPITTTASVLLRVLRWESPFLLI